jgi:hypothetical protein
VHQYNKKIESLNSEYNHMLSMTLENQRAYFERRLSELTVEEDVLIQSKRLGIQQSEERLGEMDIAMGVRRE